MNKLFGFVKTHFLTKKFIIFGIIGIVNTGIHLAIYWVIFTLLSAGPIWSNTVAFIGASTFSYFANAILTFKPKNKNTTQFSIVLLVFFIRWLINTSLTTGFDFMIVEWLGVDYEVTTWASIIAPFFGSALLIPIAYFTLDYVFQKTDVDNTEKNT